MKPLPFLIPKSTQQSIHLQEDRQPYLYDYLHQHREIQISLILKGEGQLIAGEYLGRFGPGDIYVIGSNVPHVFKNDQEYYRADSNKYAHMVSVYFIWDTFGTTFLNLPEMKPIFDHRLILDRGLKINGIAQQQLTDSIHQLWTLDGPDRLFQLFKLLQGIHNLKPYHFLTQGTTLQLSPSQGERLDVIYRFTIDHYQRSITLEEVAQQVFLSVTSFCRYFKKSTRKTYFEFLSEVRVGQACRLLQKEKEQPIYSIAYEVGFNNIANFNRQFKRIMGLTPTAYRESLG